MAATDAGATQLCEEVAAMRGADHPNIVRLVEVAMAGCCSR